MLVKWFYGRASFKDRALSNALSDTEGRTMCSSIVSGFSATDMSSVVLGKLDFSSADSNCDFNLLKFGLSHLLSFKHDFIAFFIAGAPSSISAG